MTAALRDELRQRKPFVGFHHAAFRGLTRTDGILYDFFTRMLEPFGPTATPLVCRLGLAADTLGSAATGASRRRHLPAGRPGV